MQPITTDHLTDHAPNLTIEHVQKGASGYAEYALEYPLKDRVACVVMRGERSNLRITKEN